MDGETTSTGEQPALRLLSPRAREIAAALSERWPAQVAPLGQGTDHAAFLVDDRWVLREPLEPTVDAREEVDREQRLLVLLDEVSPVPVPWPAAADAGAGVIVLERLEGTPLLDLEHPDVEVLVEPLAALLRALAAVPASAVEGIVERDEEPMATFVEEAARLATEVADALRPTQRDALEGFLAADLPPEPDPSRLGLCHNDLGAEHILVTADGQVSGVIDWSDAAWSDPARDLGRLARDLGPAAAERIARRSHGADAALAARVQLHACCALVEDLAFGLTDGPRRYADAALRAFDRTFAPWGGGSPPPAAL